MKKITILLIIATITFSILAYNQAQTKSKSEEVVSSGGVSNQLGQSQLETSSQLSIAEVSGNINAEVQAQSGYVNSSGESNSASVSKTKTITGASTSAATSSKSESALPVPQTSSFVNSIAQSTQTISNAPSPTPVKVVSKIEYSSEGEVCH